MRKLCEAIISLESLASAVVHVVSPSAPHCVIFIKPPSVDSLQIVSSFALDSAETDHVAGLSVYGHHQR